MRDLPLRTPRRAARKAAIVGGGVIGGGWAARFLLNGWDVAVFDPDPDAERKIGEVVANARRALPALYDAALPREGTLRYEADLGAAVAGAAWVQESVPERLPLKHQVFETILAQAPKNAVIGSSTSGFKPSELNTGRSRRVIVAHPFNPVYLLPLVELVGAPGRCARAADMLREIGMYPLVVTKEIDAHIADRLLEAVWRESLWLVKDGIATTDEIDEAIRMGFGLRWAQMGLFETYRIAGGEAGMRHFLNQFGPALSWPWTKLTDVPEFNDELVELIASQSEAQSQGLSIRDLERLRDDNLVAMIRALKRTGSGAGGVIRAHEAAFAARDDAPPTTTVRQQVPTSWIDDHGHMSDTHFLELASRATRRFLEMLGVADPDREAGRRYFTVETRLRLLAEIQAGETIAARTQVLAHAPVATPDGSAAAPDRGAAVGPAEAGGDYVRLLHELHRHDGAPIATVETVIVLADPAARGAGARPPSFGAALAAFVDSVAAPRTRAAAGA